MDVKKYYACGLDCLASEPSQIRHSTQLVLGEDFDRVTAERDALQQLLNARDEEVENFRAQLAEQDALLREKSGDLIRMAAHLISAPLFALQYLQDEDKKMTRARVDKAVDTADARLKDAAYELRRIADALSASAGPSAMAERIKSAACPGCASKPCMCAELIAPAVIDERAEFEAWGTDRGYFNLKREHSGKYKFHTAWAAWEGWQARAALERKPS